MKFLLPILLHLSVLVASLQAASVDDLTFRLNEAGTAYAVSDCLTSASGSLVIPSVYEGLPVISIGNSAFQYCSRLTSITIPDGVTSIGYSAFFNCTNLTNITIGDSVTSIGDNAFRDCTSLASITIPDSVTSIGDYAFFYCTNLTNITIGDSVTSIGNYVFYNCSNLTSIEIPNSVTSIGDYAFFNCTNLTNITIGDSVTSIGDYAFQGCTSLSSITIPDGVTSIGYRTFFGCSGLTSITIPDGVTSIGYEAFYNTGISFLEDTNSIKYLISDSGNTAYLIDGLYSSGNIIVPNSFLGASITFIGDGAFYGNISLANVTIFNSVISIGERAFDGCSNLTSITIPDSVTSIGRYAFQHCSNLASINFPDSVTSIGEGAFAGCSNLTSITIPDSVTSIGQYAFGGGEYGYLVNTVTLPYKFAGSAGLFGIPGDAEITVNFDDVSEGLLANTNFVAGISEEVTFDSSAVDQAIADEAQARADADASIQADIDQNELDSVAADADLQQQIIDLQTYIDNAVTQARSEGVTAGIQAVTSDPQSYQLYSESSILEMNVSNPTFSMLNESEQAQVEFTLETSTDLEGWNIEERIQRTVEATGDKFFVRIQSGTPYVTPTVVTYNHPTYGNILTDGSGNVLYGFSIDSVGGDPLYSGSAWPLATHSTDPEPDADVTAELTRGTYSITSGGPWLKINNRPVYTYVGDSEPNQASGHGLGSVWFTIKPDGTLNQ